MRIYLKLAAAILVITCAAVGLVSFMNFVKYQDTYGELLASRFAVIGQSVKQTIENGLTLGFRLDQLTNVRTIIYRFRAEDPLIRDIHTLDRRATMVFSTDPAVENTKAPPSFEMPAEDQNLWRGEYADFLLVGLPVLDNTGEIAGHVLIAYSRDLVTESLLDTRQRLLKVSLSVLVVSIAVSLACVLMSFRSMVASCRRIRDWLNDSLDSAARHSGLEVQAQTDLERHFARFWDRARSTLGRLEDLESGRKPDFTEEYLRVKAQLDAMEPPATPLLSSPSTAMLAKR